MSDMILNTLAATLDDIEGMRKATANRLRILTASEPDADGVVRGMGLGEGHYSVMALRQTLEDLEYIEKHTVKDLQTAMKRHPLSEWVKSQRGVGEKTAARLLAAVGDPYWIDEAEFEDDEGNVVYRPARTRTVSELWAYAGLHVDRPSNSAVRRKKGVQSNWKTEIKTRAYLIAEACVKTGVRKDLEDDTKRVATTKYGRVYLDRRAHTGQTHPEWTLGHSHNDAMRIVSKELLKDMWVASKALRTNDTEGEPT